MLECALSSVLEQSRHDSRIQIHVWDNASTDETEAFMREVATREPTVTYTRRPENLGASGNYKDALSQVTTPYYTGLADDDYLLPGFLSRALGEMERDSSLGAVVMQTVHLDKEGRELRVNPDERWGYGRLEPAQTLTNWAKFGHLEWSSIVFLKSAFDAVGGLDTGIGLASDVDFQMQVFLRYPVLVVQHRAAVYNLHPLQQSAALGFTYVESAVELVKRMQEFVRSQPSLGPALQILRRRYAMELCGLGWKYNSGPQLRYLLKTLFVSLQNPRYGCACLLRAVLGRVGIKQRRHPGLVRGGPNAI